MIIRITKIEHEYHKGVWLCYWDSGLMKGRYSITVAAAYSLLQNPYTKERHAGKDVYKFHLLNPNHNESKHYVTSNN